MWGLPSMIVFLSRSLLKEKVYTNMRQWTLRAHLDNKDHIVTTKLLSPVRLGKMSNKVKLLQGGMAPLLDRSESKLFTCEANKIVNPTTKNLHQPRAFLSGTNGQVYSYSTLNVTAPSPFVYSVEVNRPKKMNALNKVRSSFSILTKSTPFTRTCGARWVKLSQG